jgi:two-component system, NarL family, invasion response regulator UvrY
MIRVFLIDDHALIRTGFRMILSQEVDIEIVGEASNAEEALPLIRRLKPDVLLCDLHLPGASGLEITEKVQRIEPAPRVVICSVQEEGPMPQRLMECGAMGYISKGCDSSELLRAVRDAARGKRYLASDLAMRIALGKNDSPFKQLSDREMEVAILLCEGKRAEDIARQLNLSGKTVATHKHRLFQKLGVEDTIALARMASQYGITDPARAM